MENHIRGDSHKLLITHLGVDTGVKTNRYVCLVRMIMVTTMMMMLVVEAVVCAIDDMFGLRE